MSLIVRLSSSISLFNDLLIKDEDPLIKLSNNIRKSRLVSDNSISQNSSFFNKKSKKIQNFFKNFFNFSQRYMQNNPYQFSYSLVWLILLTLYNKRQFLATKLTANKTKMKNIGADAP